MKRGVKVALMAAGVVAAGGMVMGKRIYRELKALGLVPALVSGGGAPVRAASPYPLKTAVPSIQDTHAYTQWYDPAKVMERTQRANEAPLLMAARAWQGAKGNPAQALSALLPDSREADGAQALLHMLRDLAVQGSERAATERRHQESLIQEVKDDATRELAGVTKAEEKAEILKRRDRELDGIKVRMSPPPAYPMPEGRPGIEVVAQAARALADRRKAGMGGPYDDILLPEALRLLAFHGATDVPEAQKLPTLDGKGKAAPVNGAVKALLRGILEGDPDLQPYASKALGQLGDLETAKDIVAHPRKYPGAAISDFGPAAVAMFKDQRIAQLKKGAGSEEAAFHSLRLSYRDRETAFDLAKAGDWGAGLAYERSLALENVRSMEPADERFARYIDQYLRFPKTRQGEKALWALTANSGVAYMFAAHSHELNMPKTLEMLLRYFDYALRRTFVEQKPMDDEPIMGISILTVMWHHRLYRPAEYESYKNFYTALDALFRKHFPAGKTVKVLRNRPEFGLVQDSNLYAVHIGLKAVRWEGKEEDRKHDDFFSPKPKIRVTGVYPPKSDQEAAERIMDDQVGYSFSRADDIACVQLGHFHSLEDL